MEAMEGRQRQLEQRKVAQVNSDMNHEIGTLPVFVPRQLRQPAIVIGAGTRMGSHQGLTNKTLEHSASDPALTTDQTKCLDQLKRIIAC